MYKAKITNIEKVRHQATDTDFLDVTVEIIEVVPASEGVEASEKVVSTQKHAYNPAISREELTASVKQMVDGYKLEQEQKVANAAENAINENVYALQAELVGSEIGVNDKIE